MMIKSFLSLLLVLSLFPGAINASEANPYSAMPEEEAENPNAENQNPAENFASAEMTVAVYEEDGMPENVIYDDGNARLSESSAAENGYLLQIGEKEYQTEADRIGIIVYHRKTYLFKVNGDEIKYRIYDEEGNYEGEEFLPGADVAGDLYLVVYDDMIVCGFTCFVNGQNDIELNCFNDEGVYIHNYYGGVFNEELHGLVTLGESLYFLVKKDVVTENVFGNGGTENPVVIAELDHNLAVKSFLTIDNVLNPIDFTTAGDCLYLVTDTDIYLFSSAPELLNTLRKEETSTVVIGKNGLIAIFGDKRIDFHDAVSLALLETKVPDKFPEHVQKLNGALRCTCEEKNYRFDFVDYRKSILPEYCLPEYETYFEECLDSVGSLFGHCTLSGKDYLDFRSPNGFGNYRAVVAYSTPGGIMFERRIVERVPLKANINDQMIYPRGYRLLFNGRGTLDNRSINSNYAVLESGNHSLVISGANASKTFNFMIDDHQYSFSDEYRSGQYRDAGLNERICLRFDLNRDIDIDDVVIRGAETDSFRAENRQLDIVLKGFKETGLKNVLLEKIIYREDYCKKDLMIGKLWFFNICESKIEFGEPQIGEDCSCLFEYNDRQRQARFIEIRLANKNRDYYFLYPIGNKKIMIEGIEPDCYSFTIGLGYSDGSSLIKYYKLYDAVIGIDGDSCYGDISLLTQSDALNKMAINIDRDFKNKHLIKLSLNSKEIFNREDEQKEKNTIRAVVGFIAFFSFAAVFRLAGRRRRRTDITDKND